MTWELELPLNRRVLYTFIKRINCNTKQCRSILPGNSTPYLVITVLCNRPQRETSLIPQQDRMHFLYATAGLHEKLKIVSIFCGQEPSGIDMSGADWLHKLGFRYAPLSVVRLFWQKGS